MTPGPYLHPRLAPNGLAVALSNTGNVWIWDLGRARLVRATLDGGTVPMWTTDSARLVFGSVRGGGSPNLYIQPANGTGTTTRLTDGAYGKNPTGVTPDGNQIIFNEGTEAQRGDIGLLTLTPSPQVKPLVATRFDERGGVVSPDGRWLAYESDRSGAYEIWVQPFPASDGLWQASTAGGAQALWAPTGRELFYRAPDGALMGVAWEARDSAWVPLVTRRIVQRSYSRGGAGTTVRQYDVTGDGQRFLMMKDEPQDTVEAPSINVIQNWTEELKRLVPVP